MSVGTAILGCGMAVPEIRRTNADLERTLDTTDEWIRTRTGIRERRIAAAHESTSTFAVAAGAQALKRADLTPDDLDVVLVATCTPDLPVPGAAPLVQAELGAGRAAAFDLNAGCTGFVLALGVADGLVSSGRARHVLVCGAETLSRITDPADRTTAVLFGDGGGAVVLGPSDGPSRLGPSASGTDGSRAAWLCTTEAGTLQMRGQDVYRHAVDRMEEAARAVLGDRDPGGIDLVVPHQANARIVAALAERLGVPSDRVVCNIAAYGNTSAASIPIALAEAVADGSLRDGMEVLLVAFGAGFSWSATLLRWGHR